MQEVSRARVFISMMPVHILPQVSRLPLSDTRQVAANCMQASLLHTMNELCRPVARHVRSCAYMLASSLGATNVALLQREVDMLIEYFRANDEDVDDREEHEAEEAHRQDEVNNLMSTNLASTPGADALLKSVMSQA